MVSLTVSFGEYRWGTWGNPAPSERLKSAQQSPLVPYRPHPPTVHTREVAGSIPAAPIRNWLQIAYLCLQIRHNNRSCLPLWQVFGKYGHPALPPGARLDRRSSNPRVGGSNPPRRTSRRRCNSEGFDLNDADLAWPLGSRRATDGATRGHCTPSSYLFKFRVQTMAAIPRHQPRARRTSAAAEAAASGRKMRTSHRRATRAELSRSRFILARCSVRSRIARKTASTAHFDARETDVLSSAGSGLNYYPA